MTKFWNFYSNGNGGWTVDGSGFSVTTETRGQAHSLTAKLNRAYVRSFADLIKILAQHDEY